MATYRCKDCHRQDRHVVAVHDSGGRVGDRRIPAEKQWICEFFPKFGTALCSADADARDAAHDPWTREEARKRYTTREHLAAFDAAYRDERRAIATADRWQVEG